MRRIIATIVLVFLLIVLLLALWFGHESVTGVARWRYDKDVALKLIQTSSGGALGDETYRVSYIYRGEERLFFEGVGGANFALKRHGKSVQITLCDGTISRAGPIWLDPPRNELIHVDLKLDCGDRRGAPGERLRAG